MVCKKSVNNMDQKGEVTAIIRSDHLIIWSISFFLFPSNIEILLGFL